MKMVELEQVCVIKNGYAFKSEEYKSEGVPLLRISNFNDGDVLIDEDSIFLNPEYLKSKSDFIVEKGDILIALSGATTGKYGFYNYDYPSLLNQRVGLLKSGTSKELYERYFYHYLNVLKADILRNAGGAAQPNISTNAIGKFQIPLPPLPVQQKIAAILDAADAYRQKTKALIEKYDQLAQSLFLDMFGDPVKNGKGWEKRILKDICTKITDGEHGTVERLDSGKMYLMARNVSHDGLTFDEVSYISQEDHDKIFKRCNAEKDDLLIVCVGATIGRCCLVPEIEDFSLARSVALIKPKKQELNSIFMLYQFKQEKFQNQILSKRNASAQAGLYTGQIQQLELICPKLELQNQFAERIQLIEAQKQQAQSSLQKAEDLFNSLLQSAFSGGLVG